MLGRMLHRLALRDPGYDWLYIRVAKPSGKEWADLLRERGDFHAMGENCYIDPGASIDDRALIRLGNNVRLSLCSVFGHDGAVNMINRAYGLHLDSVGKVDIRDNVYVGHRAIILPGVTIGPNAIVSAGSVVRSDVAEGDVVAGVPARRVGRLAMSVEILKAKNALYPWSALIQRRQGETDPALEPELTRQRVRYFFSPE